MILLGLPSALHTGLLEQQLATSGLVTTAVVVGDVLELAALSEAQRAAAQAVVDAHPTTAQALRDQAAARHANESTIRQQAGDAIAANKAFLAIASPTNAQTLAQVKALTRQQNGLIRLGIQSFDGID